MNTIRILAACLVGLAACQTPNAAPPPFDAEAHLAEWVDLWGTYDLDRVDQLFLADDRVTYFSSEFQGLITGAEALRSHHEGFGFVPGGVQPERALWVEDVQSRAYGSTAVVSAVWRFGDPAAADSAQRGPMTAVYTWTDAGYRIAHMHFANY